MEDKWTEKVKSAKIVNDILNAFPKPGDKNSDKDECKKDSHPRVALVTNSYPPNLNGVSKATYNLEQALLAHGIEVYIITPRVPGVVYSPNVLAIDSLASPSYISQDLRFSIYFSPSAIDFIKKHSINIIHSQDAYHGGLDSVLLAKVTGAHTVHTYHTYMEDYEYFKVPGYKLYIRNYSNIVCNAYDTVIALSPKIREYLKKIEVKKPVVELPNIYLEPEDTLENKEKEEVSQKSVLEFITNNGLEKTFNIITFGRVAKEKNLIAGIEAIKDWLISNQDVRYIIAGFGPQVKELEKYIKDHNLEEKVFLYGKYVISDIKYLCKYSKFFLISSYTEVLPTTPLEAMSFALPVVCVDDSCYLYIVKDDHNGFYQPIENLNAVCKSLYQDPNKLSLISQNAYLSYQKYTSHDYAKDYIHMYEEVIRADNFKMQKRYSRGKK